MKSCLEGALQNFNLENYNTLKLKSISSEFYLPVDKDDFYYLLQELKNPIVFGAGSNILFSSKGVTEPLICTKKLDNFSIKDNIIEAQAGIKTQLLSKIASENSLSGFEFLIGIPASLGGAIYMNAGAHNQTISDCLVSCEVFDLEKKEKLILSKDELCFSYRHSILKEKPYVLVSAKFALEKYNKEKIKERMNDNLKFRKEKQPNLSEPNLGSVFKNPQKCSAGALIDKCKLKGHKFSNCEVYNKHCNFIINTGELTSLEYLSAMLYIYEKVKEEFNIELEAEIEFIGKMTDKEKEIWKIIKK
ncbi:UDP-N-acetylmuramate dehydrogenase [bacterium]|nr:UDP-N-acetylmuramate dehydrogenase [bacterium]